jgi:precorrin-2 dehydrogenase/sirohydrochlorin ferrochelatase
MPKYPIYLELEDKQAVLIGAGSVAARKAKTLVATGANVKVVAQNIEPAFQELCEGLSIEIIQGDYSKEYIQDAFLVIAATNDNTLNTQIFQDCQQLKTLCNVVDVPHLCNFYVPAVIQRGDLQVAISTNGKCPAFAAHLRRKFQEFITEDHEKFLNVLDHARQCIIQQIPPSKRKGLLSKLSEDDSYQYFLDKGDDAWKLMARELISSHKT